MIQKINKLYIYIYNQANCLRQDPPQALEGHDNANPTNSIKKTLLKRVSKIRILKPGFPNKKYQTIVPTFETELIQSESQSINNRYSHKMRYTP